MKLDPALTDRGGRRGSGQRVRRRAGRGHEFEPHPGPEIDTVGRGPFSDRWLANLGNDAVIAIQARAVSI
jgi:hypothetical protein